MVAIVSGNSLGLELSSLGTLGAQGLFGSAGHGNSGEAVYVNALTGNLVVQRRDEFLASRGLDAEALRTYNSQGLPTDDNGDQWTLGVYLQRVALKEGTLNTAGSSLTRIGRDGSQATYVWDSARALYISTAGDGAHDTIVYIAGQFEWTEGSSRIVEKSDAATGRLTSAADANGNTTTYHYNAAGYLTEVRSPSGEITRYDYTGNRLDRIRTEIVLDDGSRVNRAAVHYGYDSRGRLETVTVDLSPEDGSITDGHVYTTTYTYAGTSKRVLSLSQSDGTYLSFTYTQVDGAYRVKTVSDGSGTTTFNYNTSTRRTTVTDAMGKLWLYDHDAAGRLVKVTSPAVAGVKAAQQFLYDADGNLIKVINGDGDAVVIDYDVHGNPIRETDGQQNVIVRTYNAANQLLTETTTTTIAAPVFNQGGVTVVGDQVGKTSGTDGRWDAAFRSSSALTRFNPRVMFRPEQNDKAFAIGLSTDPGADHTLASMDYALFFTDDGMLQVWRSGQFVAEIGAYEAGQDVSIAYYGSEVQFSWGNNSYNLDAVVGQTLYVDSSFRDLGATISGLVFDGYKITAPNGVSVVDNTITKYSSVAEWDSSLRSLHGNWAASVDFRPTGINQKLAIGLSTNPGLDDGYASINFAFYLATAQVDGEHAELYVSENGNLINVGSYAAGDYLTVEYDGTYARYFQNGEVIREVQVAVTGPVYLDSSFYTVGAKVKDVQFRYPYDELSTDLMAIAQESTVKIVGDSVSKVGGSDGKWDSAVRSRQGYTGEANVTFAAAQSNKSFMVGLTIDPNAGFDGSSIDWALYCTADGTLMASEMGQLVDLHTTYDADDKLEVTYDGSAIKYLRNGVVLRSVTVQIDAPLYLDSSFYNTGARAEILRFGDLAKPELTKRLVYSASRPDQLRFVISPDGRVTRYDYNSFGERISQIEYAASRYDVTGLAADAVPTEAQMLSWAGGQDLTKIVRKDFEYDARGLLSKLKDYDATDGDGNGLGERLTRFIYDQAGRLLQTIQPAATQGDQAGSPFTQYTYDGLGRVLTVSNALGLQSTATYTDNLQQVVVSYAGGASTTSVYDSNGRLVSVMNSGRGTTRYYYDALGHLLMTESPDLALTFSLYDAAGRRIASIDGDGSLTEYFYDRAGRPVREYRYSTPASREQLYTLMDDVGGGVVPMPTNPPLDQIRPATNPLDLQSWRVLDDAGRLVYEIGDGGEVTQYDYDGANRLVRRTQYAVRIATVASPTTWSVKAQLETSGVMAGAEGNRVTRYFYDRDGHQTGVLDAEGYLTRQTYNDAGRLISVRRYATQATPILQETGTLEAVTPDAHVDDQLEVFFYDGRGQLVGHVDAERYLTVTSYNERGLVRSQVRFSEPLHENADLSAELSTLLGTLRPGGVLEADDRQSSRTYTLTGKLRTETNFEGTTTRYEYDARDNLVRTEVGVGLVDARTRLARYDAWGRVIAELSATAAALITPEMNQVQVDAVWAAHGVHLSYDAADRLVSRTDANQHRTLYYYDADGRLTHTINALGEVEERSYNTLGQLSSTVRYGNAISLDGLAGGLVNVDLTSALDPDPATDSVIRYAYDAQGRLQAVTDATGAVQTNDYNTFGDVVERWVPWQGGSAINSDRRQELFTYDRLGQLETSVADATGVASVTATERDAFGRVVKTDSNGRTQEWAYDRLGRAVQTVDGNNPARVMTYDAFDQLATVRDEYDQTTAYHYDKANRKVTVTTPEGVSVTTIRNEFGEIFQVIDGNDVVTEYRYDLDGRLKDRYVDGVRVEHLDYDGAGRLVAQFDGRNVQTSFTYDEANRVLTRTVAPGTGDEDLNLVTRWQYDAKGQAWRVTDPEGTVSEYTFTLNGQTLTRTVDPLGLKLKTEWTYDAEGRVLTVIDPRRSTTQYGYDRLGRRTSEVVDAGGLNIGRSYSYDKNGNVLSATDGLQHATRYRYDANGRLEFTVDPTGAVTRKVYDARGKTSHEIRYAMPIGLAEEPTPVEPVAGDWVTRYFYDDDGRLEFTVDPSGALTRTSYDDNGNVSAIIRYSDTLSAAELPGDVVADAIRDQVTRFAYDAHNRESWRADATGAVTRSEYDGNGNLVRRIRLEEPLAAEDDFGDINLAEAEGRIEHFVHDAANRLTWYADATGAVSHTEYNDDGSIARTTRFATLLDGELPDDVQADPVRDRADRFEYDGAGRLEYTIDASGSVTRHERDENGNVVRLTRYADALSVSESLDDLDSGAADQVTRIEYDAANRETWRANPMNEVASTEYDTVGNVLSRTRYANTVTSGALPHTVAVSADNLDRIERWSYDPANRLTWRSDATGAVTGTAYDAFGQVVTETRYATPAPGVRPENAQASPGQDRVTSYVYDTANRVRFSVDALGYVTRSEFDAFGNLVLQHRFDDLPESREAPGSAVADEEVDRVERYEYDGANRLKKFTDALGGTEEHGYDAFGDRRTFKNKNDAVWHYTFDASGRVLTETSPAVDLYSAERIGVGPERIDVSEQPEATVITVYTYDAFGSVRSRTEAAGRPGEERTTEYAYDLAGRQVKVTYPSVQVYNESLAELAANSRLGHGARDERLQPLVVLTWYDSFGNAVSNLGVNGAPSFKAYDAAGRVTFEVDALGYVTGYERNAFGEATTVTRYSHSTGFNSVDPAAAAQLVTTELVDDAVNDPVIDHSSNRVLSNRYDLLGRVTLVTEPNAFYYDSGTGETGVASKQTESLFNAFGELVRVRELANPGTNAWLETFHYYDVGGLKRATVDAGGFLTTFDYDTVGNLQRQVEYSEALTEWDALDHGPVTPNESLDRATRWTWDLLNRKTSETKEGVSHYVSSTTTDIVEVKSDLTTYFGYDAVGNQTITTDAAGGVTRTYYDALGRIRAVTAPTRLGEDGQALTPVVEFWRDAHGNVLAKLERAKTATAFTAANYEVLADAENDRITRTLYDASGRALQVQDAGGFMHYSSYTADGKLAKSWQTVTNVDEQQQTLYTAYSYDALGRLEHSFSPGPVDGEAVSTDFRYNAFGEVTWRGKDGDYQEYFAYDNAGHLWKTNSGDGYATVYLYDVLGRQTAEISSAGSGRPGAEPFNVQTAQEAASRTDTRRINIKYNELGHVTERLEAERQTAQAAAAGTAVAVRRASADASIVSSEIPRWYAAPPNGEYKKVSWSGTNSVVLSWATLEALGNGDVKVDLTYLTQDSRFAYDDGNGGIYYEIRDWGHAPEVRTQTRILAANVASAGTTINWADDPFGNTGAGISAIKRLQVSVKNADGEWVTIIDRDPTAGRPFGAAGAQVEIAAPQTADAQVTFKYRLNTTSTWVEKSGLDLAQLGDSLVFQTGGLADGTYLYEVWTTDSSGVSVLTLSDHFNVSGATGDGTVSVRATTSSAQVSGSMRLTDWSLGGEDGGGATWDGSNQVDLAWTSLASLGTGDVRVELSYLTLDLRDIIPDYNYPPAELTVSRDFTSQAADAGLMLDWVHDGGGGISAITRLKVFKRNAQGNWIQVIDRHPAGGRPFNLEEPRLEITAPQNADTQVSLKYRPVGGGSWIVVPAGDLPRVGPVHLMNADSIADGQYDYEVWHTDAGGQASLASSGSFMVGLYDVSQSTQETDAVWEQPVVVFERDRWGNALSQSDPRSRDWLTTFTYNRDNQVISERRPGVRSLTDTGIIHDSSPERFISYDALGRQRAIKDARENVNATDYDAGGNLVRERHADEGEVTYFYDAFGQRVRMVDALGNEAAAGSETYLAHTTAYGYDRLGRHLSTTRGQSTLGAVAGWTVDVNLVRHSLGRQNLTDTFTYDEAGRKLTSTNGANETTSYLYDAAGNIAQTRTAGGQVTEAAYDSFGRKISEKDANLKTATWRFGYFGQLEDHTDIGGAVYDYAYDDAGQLIAQTNTREQNLRYTYDAAGQLIRINDVAVGKISTFEFDLAGRHLRETVSQTGQVLQDNHLRYDMLGQLVESADTRAHLIFEYDEAGNRIKVVSHVRVAVVNDPNSETVEDSERYFVYDVMNRQTAVDAVDEDGNISETQGHQIGYDANGNRTSDRFWGNKVTATTHYIYRRDWQSGFVIYEGETPVYTKTTDYVDEIYGYDALGRLETVDRDGTLVDVRWYDGAGRVVQSGPVSLPIAYAEKLNDGVPADEQIGMEVRLHHYDAHGRLLRQRVLKGDGETRKYEIDYRDETITDVGDGPDDEITYVARGYDAVGNVLRYKFENFEGDDYTNVTEVVLERYEGYVEKSTRVYREGGAQQGSSISEFDENGFLISIDDATEDTLDRTMVNDAAGRVLRVRQSGNNLYTHLVNGEMMGKYGVGPHELDPRTSKNQAKFQQVAEFEFGYRSISGSYPAPSVGAFTVRQGDSLQAIAKAAYGDASQWWRIAQANGLQGENDLRVGQTLSLPSAVAGNTNDAGTFKPYNASEVIGDTSPNLPPPKVEGCGAVGTIIMIVVAVVVTYYLGPIAKEALGVVAGTVVTGAAASVASQAVGEAIGATKFSWKQVAASAIASGATAGAGAVLGNVTNNVYINAAVRAALSSAVSQAINVELGLQDAPFSWRNVAASAAAAVVGEAVGPDARFDDEGNLMPMVRGEVARWDRGPLSDVFGTDSLGRFATGLTAGVASGLTAAALRGGRFTVQRVAVDAFGNALGNGLVDAMSSDQTGANARSDLNKFNRENDEYYNSPAPLPADTPSRDWFAGSSLRLGESGRGPRLGTGSIEPDPTPDDLQAAFRQSERDYRSRTERSVAGSGYVARNGDSISRIVGSSDPQAIGNFMLANGLTSSNLEAGRNYFRPDEVTAYGDSVALGQAVLNNDNARLAALAKERFAFSDGRDARDIREGFAYQSRKSRELTDLQGQSDYQAKLASGPQHYLEPTNVAAQQAAEVRRASLLNYLNGQGTMALGGVFAAGVMIGSRDVVVASQVSDDLAPIDSLLSPTGGIRASSTLARLRGRNGLLNDLRTFESETLQFGNNTYLLDRRGMKHILERHHPDYWAGQTKEMQTFLNPSMSIDDVANVVRDVMKQNRTLLAEPHKPFGPQIEGTVGGVDYVLGISRGRVGQLYPKPIETGN